MNEGLHGTSFDLPEALPYVKIKTLPSCVPVEDKTFCMSNIALFWSSLSRMVQINWKCRPTIFSTIRLKACNVHMWTRSIGIGYTGFHLPSVVVPVIGFAAIFEQNNPPPQPLDFFPKAANVCCSFPIVGFACGCEYDTPICQHRFD